MVVRQLRDGVHRKSRETERAAIGLEQTGQRIETHNGSLPALEPTHLIKRRREIEPKPEQVSEQSGKVPVVQAPYGSGICEAEGKDQLDGDDDRQKDQLRNRSNAEHQHEHRDHEQADGEVSQPDHGLGHRQKCAREVDVGDEAGVATDGRHRLND